VKRLALRWWSSSFHLGQNGLSIWPQDDLANDKPDELYAIKKFDYPYEGYEQFCEENGCDPATGFPKPEPPESSVHQDIALRELTRDGWHRRGITCLILVLTYFKVFRDLWRMRVGSYTRTHSVSMSLTFYFVIESRALPGFPSATSIHYH